MAINVAAVVGALAQVDEALPLALTAFQALKTIFLRTNPGKTEADYIAYLKTSAQANIDDTEAILQADGWTENADGSWTKPSAPVA